MKCNAINRIFADIAEQIVQHAPQQPTVCQSHHTAFVGVDDDVQTSGQQFLVVVADGLMDDLVDNDGFRFDGYVAGGCLAGLYQIFRQLFQLVGLAVQNGYVLGGGFRQILRYYKI